MSQGLLAGKRGVILGVANEKSIAWGCAKACADQGAQLAFSFMGEALEKRVRPLVNEAMPGSPILQCDLTKDEEIASFFDQIKAEWGTIDFLVHSVAFARRDDLKGRFVDTSRHGFALALDVSAFSLVAAARAAEPLMPNGGSIVTMTYYGAEKAVTNYNVMGVAKAALEASVRYLAADLGPSGIRVNAISAGAISTLSSSAIGSIRSMLSVSQQVAPLRRAVTQDEVGASTLYLVSDLASGVTGDVLHVDCGYHVLGVYTVLEEDEDV